MAKFGEADPRWLVRDMGKDGTNVNGWHWQTKKDVSGSIRDGVQVGSQPTEYGPGIVGAQCCACQLPVTLGRDTGSSSFSRLCSSRNHRWVAPSKGQ